MTRINCGINPSDLTDKHLIAEHREIKRIPNLISKGKYNKNKIPERFTLGTGHVRFFYDKLGYLLKRYRQLYKECKARGFNIQNYESAWNSIPKELMNDYFPTESDRELVRKRISERLKWMKLNN